MLTLLITIVQAFPNLVKSTQIFEQEQKWFNQTLNHFQLPQQEAGVFKQRYWDVQTYWNPKSGPVFLYLCGEYECPGVPDNRLFPMQLAKYHQARFLVLEHRYYGQSLPYGEASALPQLYFYLTVEQALSDIAHFIKGINQEISAQYGREAKWLVIGGSYPGALSAWFRTRYPDLVVGSWSSSGVVKPILYFTDFDKQVYLSAAKSGPGCVQSIQNIATYMTNAYQQNTISEISDIFNATEQFSGWDQKPFIFYVTDVIAELIQYGHRTELCTALEVDNILDQLRNVKSVGDKYGSTDPTGYDLKTLRSYLWFTHLSGRQWYWQKCTQVGWLQGPSQYKMRSELLDLSYWHWFCNIIFDYPGGLPLPDTNSTSSYLSYEGSNIIYVNGGEDPWQWASVRQWENELRPAVLVDCNDCGHCVDLYTPKPDDPPELKKARETIANYVAKWLSQQNQDGKVYLGRKHIQLDQ